MEKISFSNFNIEHAQQLYQSLKTNEVIGSMRYLTIAIATVLIISKMIKVYRNAYDSEKGIPNMRHMVSLLSEYIVFLAIITALPHIVSLVEKLLSGMETSLLNAWGKNPDVGLSVLEKEFDRAWEHMQDQKSNPFGIFNLMIGLDLLATTIIKPLLYYCIKHLYILAVFVRYAYLLMLEIVAPVAIVCLLSEKTQQHFQNWVKNMVVCYLLIPGFMLADSLSNGVWISISETDRYTFIPMIMVFILKLYLFKAVSQKIINLI